MKFYLVDVFAIAPYTGNPLGVVLDAGALSGDQMQQIAREINYSETTFILSRDRREEGYDVRIFTPTRELPFAGHPCLGTAWAIAQEVLSAAATTVRLNLPVGQIPVVSELQNQGKPIWWMQQPTPTFAPSLEAATAAEILGIDADAIDPRFPIQDVSTGLPFIIVPLRHLSAVKEIRFNRDRYWAAVAGREAQCIFVFCPETEAAENDLHARAFTESVGIPEDPATGSANGCLAGYLAHHNYFGHSTVEVRVEQGYEIGRPSLLFLQAKPEGSHILVRVGGRVVATATGEWLA